METINLLFPNDITTQSYGEGGIPGVKIYNLPIFQDERGTFSEVLRTSKITFDIKQCSHSVIEPGAIKAFHIHKHQSDLWYIPHNTKLLINLVDLRNHGQQTLVLKRMRKFMSGVLLLIPNGVAHGCANLTDKDSNLIYFTDKEFDINNPDEHRLPYDFFDSPEYRKKDGDRIYTLWEKIDG